MKSPIHADDVLLQRVLSPVEFESLGEKILSIPGFEQNFPSHVKVAGDGDVSAGGDDEGVFPDVMHEVPVLPLANVTAFVQHFPYAMVRSDPRAFNMQEEGWVKGHLLLEPAVVDGGLIRRLNAALQGVAGVALSIKDVWYAKPPGGDCVLKFVQDIELRDENLVRLRWESGCATYEMSPAPTADMEEEHVALTVAALRAAYEQVGVSAAWLNAEGILSVRATEATGETVSAFRDLTLKTPWLAGAGTERRCEVSLFFRAAGETGEWPQTRAALERVAAVLDTTSVAPVGYWSFHWRFLPEVNPLWLQVAGLATHLEPVHGPIEVVLGFMRLGPQKQQRVTLYLYKVEGGSLLVAKRAGEVVAERLSEHFNEPWRCGEVPAGVTLTARNVPDLFEEPTAPPAHHRVPAFFRRGEDPETTQAREALMAELDRIGYFEGYPEAVRAGAREGIEAAFHGVAETPEEEAERIAKALTVWEEPYPWRESLEKALLALQTASYDIFRPENITVEFEDEPDDGYPPEPGSEVRIAFDFGGRRHEITAEYFYKSIPAELVPGVAEAMTAAGCGVTFVPVDDGGSRFALCAPGAVEGLIGEV